MQIEFLSKSNKNYKNRMKKLIKKLINQKKRFKRPYLKKLKIVY